MMHYTRMHGAGNSFVVIENRNGELDGTDLSALAVRLCAETGESKADGMMIVLPGDAEADFGMLFYNSDGTPGEMCGNGARCIVRYGLEHGYAPDAQNIRVRATAGLVTGRRIEGEIFEIRLNDPTVVDLHRAAEAAGRTYDCAYLELGCPGLPHAVVEVEESALDDLDALRVLGRELRRSPAFPKGANVTFVHRTGLSAARAITFERGVEDFTLACGTGCGCTAAAMILRGRVPGNSLEIDMPGGHLSVRLTPENGTARDIYLTGPTAVVGEGKIE